LGFLLSGDCVTRFPLHFPHILLPHRKMAGHRMTVKDTGVSPAPSEKTQPLPSSGISEASQSQAAGSAHTLITFMSLASEHNLNRLSINSANLRICHHPRIRCFAVHNSKSRRSLFVWLKGQ